MTHKYTGPDWPTPRAPQSTIVPLTQAMIDDWRTKRTPPRPALRRRLWSLVARLRRRRR
jgi:hypothetical protein